MIECLLCKKKCILDSYKQYRIVKKCYNLYLRRIEDKIKQFRLLISTKAVLNRKVRAYNKILTRAYKTPSGYTKNRREILESRQETIKEEAYTHKQSLRDMKSYFRKYGISTKQLCRILRIDEDTIYRYLRKCLAYCPSEDKWKHIQLLYLIEEV